MARLEGSAAVRLNGTKSRYHDENVSALAGLAGLVAVVVPMADDPKALANLRAVGSEDRDRSAGRDCARNHPRR